MTHLYITSKLIDSQLIHIRFHMKMKKVPMLTLLYLREPNNIKTIIWADLENQWLQNELEKK